MASGSKGGEELTPQQVQQQYSQIEKECSTFLNKIAELEQEANEHALVLKAFEKVEPGRRCFRMVGGVLVERTVAEVSPAVKQNQEKIGQFVKKLEEELKKRLSSGQSSSRSTASTRAAPRPPTLAAAPPT
eukprot:SRR837773.13816.p1 GENE.SRR837773.13816~~SRR837773.13816.p1  ORF type:complete len:138 (+),score=44.87 SRR837773.13816:24-416(+)